MTDADRSDPLAKLSRSIDGKAALVTGAASGMGRAIARLLADLGAVVGVTDVDEAGAVKTAQEIRERGRKAEAWRLDVGERDDIERVVGEMAERCGGIDILVNNAGVALGAPIDAAAYETVWQRAFDIMLTGQVRLIRAALPHLERSGAGRIVNVASTEGLGASRRISPYTAAKHGVVGLTRSLAVELGDRGITVNCICPGPIHTGMTSGIPDVDKQKFARRKVPVGRYGDPEEVAHIVAGIVIPAASYLNGAIIPVDGGMTAKHD
jgi:3-oxoacyl-[acyl-carrier protein] reductase